MTESGEVLHNLSAEDLHLSPVGVIKTTLHRDGQARTEAPFVLYEGEVDDPNCARLLGVEEPDDVAEVYAIGPNIFDDIITDPRPVLRGLAVCIRQERYGAEYHLDLTVDPVDVRPRHEMAFAGVVVEQLGREALQSGVWADVPADDIAEEAALLSHGFKQVDTIKRVIPAKNEGDDDEIREIHILVKPPAEVAKERPSQEPSLAVAA
jgi:hypothetical protein